MRQRFATLTAFALVFVTLVAVGRFGSGTLAQDAATIAADHPIVGSWHMDSGFAPSMVTFHGDGSYFEVDAEGSVGVGSWEATGEQTVNMTAVYLDPDVGSQVRASFEVAADGQSFTATFTLELLLPDGTSTGEYGPGVATGTRLTVEAPGSPAGTIEDLFVEMTEQPTTPIAADLEAYDIGWRTAEEPGPSVTLTVAPGETIDVANIGSAPHNFTVEALDISVDLPPGEAATVTIPADTAAGEYEFICDVPGHAAAGMVGTLIVE